MWCEMDKDILLELGFNMDTPAPIMGHSTCSNSSAEGSTNLKQYKHMDIRCHIVRETALSGHATGSHVNAEQNKVNGFPKPLDM